LHKINLYKNEIGKKDAKALRNEGQVPCVVYGGKEELKVFL